MLLCESLTLDMHLTFKLQSILIDYTYGLNHRYKETLFNNTKTILLKPKANSYQLLYKGYMIHFALNQPDKAAPCQGHSPTDHSQLH